MSSVGNSNLLPRGEYAGKSIKNMNNSTEMQKNMSIGATKSCFIKTGEENLVTLSLSIETENKNFLPGITDTGEASYRYFKFNYLHKIQSCLRIFDVC
jgi:hypothetical protein